MSTVRDKPWRRDRGTANQALALVNGRHRVKDWHVGLLWMAFVGGVLWLT